MDWNILLFIAKWVLIVLFYSALGVLLWGVYRESGQRLEKAAASAETSIGRLRVIDPGSDQTLHTGKVFDLYLETSLGSEAENDILLKDQFVSRRHARLFWDGAVWWLEDLGSKNGTLMNGQPSLPNRPQTLPPHAQSTVGDIVFELID
jgi:predicted component of type VI protein secretion system